MSLDALFKETSMGNYRGEESQFFTKDELTEINEAEDKEKDQPTEPGVTETLFDKKEEEEEKKQEEKKPEPPKKVTFVRKEEPKKEPEPEEQAPASIEEAYNWHRAQFIAAEFRKAGYPLQQDGSNMNQLMEELGKANAHQYYMLVEAANKYGSQQAHTHNQKVVLPYMERHKAKRINTFIERFESITPDVREYLDEMNELAPELVKALPEMADNPMAAISILYQRAKEKKLSAVAAQAKDKPKVSLEKGGAQRPKAVKETEKTSVQKEIDRVFDTSVREGPIDAFFQGLQPTTR